MRWLRRLSNVVRRSRLDDELRQELETHLALIEDEERRHGATAAEAAERARRRFGRALSYREHAIDGISARWLEDAWSDLRFAVRQLRKAPGFAAVAVISLALGIGANAAIFTLINAVLLRPLPIRDPQRLVLLGDARSSGVGVGVLGRSFDVYSYALYKHLEGGDVFDGLCAVQSGEQLVGVRRPGSASTSPAEAKLVSGNYFDVLGVSAAIGRALAPADDDAAAPPVAVVSFPYWESALHGDRSAIGSTVDLNGTSFTIVGVAPPAFFGDTMQPDPPSFWLPIAASRALDDRSLADKPDSYWLYLLGRLRPNVTLPQADARLTLMLQNWLTTRAGAPVSETRRAAIAKSRVEVQSAERGVPRLRREYAPTLRLLLGISVAVLLVACANIAGLLLARGIARTGERSLRVALGATRGRLVRQSLTESLVLALAGGALALGVAPFVAQLLVALAFDPAAYVPIQTAPDARVLAFTFALSCAAAVVFGLAPALRVRSDIGAVLKDSRFRLGKALIVGEITVSLVVLAGAASLAHSLANLSRQPFGFDRGHVLVVNVDPGLIRYPFSRLGALYEQLETRLNALPGVESAGFSYYSPFNGCCWAFSVTIPGYTPRPQERMSALLNRVSARYFETLGTRVLRGRVFTERDTAGSRRVVVVSDAFVRRFFPNVDPIGRIFHIDSEGDEVDIEIVGVVENAKYDEPRDEERPAVYLPFLQMKADERVGSSAYISNFIHAIAIRSAGDPADVAGMVRRTLTEIDPNLPVLRVETLSDQIRQTLSQDTAVATLAGVFGLLALALTCIGLYGLMAYLVQRRTTEIGIRMALGADRGTVVGMVIRDALVQAVAGILIGIPMAFLVVRLIVSQLFGVSAADPAHAAAAAAVLVAFLAIAGYLPARRASRIDPIQALRHE